MRCDQLTGDQIEALRNRFAPMLEYLGRLEQWMHKRQFPADDQLLQLVIESRKCVQGVDTEVSYHTPDRQFGRRVHPPQNIIPVNADDPLGRKPRR